MRVDYRGHRKVGQRASVDELDRVTKHAKSDEEWIEDDWREKSSGQLQEQRNR